MFANKQIIRNIIFAVFCVLILCLSLVLLYYITIFDEKVEVTIEAIEEDMCEKSKNMSMTTFIFKIICAFFAGGLVSDKLFLKLGII